MENPTQLAQRFREVLLNGKWIANTNYKQQLSDVTWEQAVQQIADLNSIAALTFHVNYYIGGVLNVFDGGELEIRDQYSFDMPAIASAEDWQKLLDSMWTNAERFAQHIEQMSDEQLAAVFVKPTYGNYRRNINGLIEHSYYHLGQISLIKKLIKSIKF